MEKFNEKLAAELQGMLEKAANPPSTGTTMPVTKLDASLISQISVPISSAGSP